MDQSQHLAVRATLPKAIRRVEELLVTLWIRGAVCPSVTRIGIASLTALSAVALGWPAAAHASCIVQTPEQQLARADVVFVGTALEGPTATGTQRFRVATFVKGEGPDVVGVATGVVVRPDGTGSITSVSVEAAAGERWRIYGTRAEGDVLETSVCAGSRLLAGAASGEFGGPAESRRPVRALAAAALGVGLVVLAAALLGRRLRAS